MKDITFDGPDNDVRDAIEKMKNVIKNRETIKTEEITHKTEKLKVTEEQRAELQALIEKCKKSL
jgi:hypothetical protein